MEFNIQFRAFEMGDEVFINELRNDELRESKVGGNKRFVSLDRERKWVNDIIMGDSKTTMYFAITEVGSDEIIGYTSISDINFQNGTCFWSGIKISPQFSGKGYGLQVALKIIKYVFEELRMVRCIGVCQESHMAAYKLMEKAGFKPEGLMRKKLFKNGTHINQYLFSIIDDDYADIKLKYSI